MKHAHLPLIGRALLGLLGSTLAGSALAQAQGLLTQRFVVDAGAFVLGTSVTPNLNGQSIRNPEINFGETFGTSGNDTSPRIDALWRITPKHHLRLTAFEHGRKGSKVIDRDVRWGDYTFKANGKVDTELKVKVLELTYEYALMRSTDHEVSLSLGVHDRSFSTRLSGAATITGSANAATQQTQSNDLSAPLPVLGVRAGWVVAPDWLVEGRVQSFSIKSNDTRGQWTELRLGATWMLRPNLGLGLAYDLSLIHI